MRSVIVLLALLSTVTTVAASGTFYKCSNGEIIHSDWNDITRAGGRSYSHYSPIKRDYDRRISPRLVREVGTEGDLVYYRGKKCRAMSGEEVGALQWND